jgi:hypothetical protein
MGRKRARRAKLMRCKPDRMIDIDEFYTRCVFDDAVSVAVISEWLTILWMGKDAREEDAFDN